MDFRTVRIPYWGRAKYNAYGTGDSIRSIIQNYMGTGGSGGDAGYGGAENRGGNGTSFFAYLDKGSATYSDTDLMGNGVNETIHVYGFKNMDRAQTLIGNLDNSGATTSGLTKYDISGITENGMQLEVRDNGTTGTTLRFHFTTGLPSEGQLQIPVNVNINDNPLDPYHEVWHTNQSWVNSTVLTFSWSKAGAGSSSYVMDLSNEMAYINCDSGGNMYSASIMTVVCSAFTTMDGKAVSGVTYTPDTDVQYQARGINITNHPESGMCEISFTYSGSGQYFAFNGASLPLVIKASLNGEQVAAKTMNIYKNYPGQNGAPATSHWINTSVSQVLYNPNKTGAEALTPSAVTAEVWKQVGYLPPEIDTATTIFYGYDTESPTYTLPATGAETNYAAEYIAFALRLENSSTGAIYEMETVPTIKAGLNGESGATGASGKNGTDGVSSWYLSLDNDNASINADASGTIYYNAAKPTCHGTLYYGNTPHTGATYKINPWNTTMQSGLSNGVLTLSFKNGFTFPDDVLGINITAYNSSGDSADTKVMWITKSKAGASGEPAVSYWLETSTGEVFYDPNSTATTHVYPPSISATSKMQKGEGAPGPATGVTYTYSKVSRGTGAETTQSDYTNKTLINITTGDAEAYMAIRFRLFKGSEQVDMEDIPILKNGLNSSAETATGAAVRGPYDYATHSASTRCWCAGEENSDSSGCGCQKWIDVILKDGKYYLCNHSYNGPLYAYFPTYWTEADQSFDFVAAGLILSSAASINFLTNNVLYLRGTNNQITGGAKGGTGTTFWAGAQEPGDAPFKVNNDGTLVATKGTFGPFTIGTDEAGTSSLRGIQSASTYDEKWKYDAYINPENTHFTGQLSADTGVYTETVSIAPYRNPDKYDGNATIEVLMDYKKSTSCGNISPQYTENKAFNTNGVVFANHFDGPVIAGEDGKLGSAVMSLLPTEIIYITDDSSLFTTCGTWYINGQDTGIDGSEPVSLFRYSNYTWWFGNTRLIDMGVCITGGTGTPVTGGTPYWHFNGVNLGLRSDTHPNLRIKTNATIPGQNGYWEVYATASNYLITGIGSNNSNFIRRNNVIYIEL